MKHVISALVLTMSVVAGASEIGSQTLDTIPVDTTITMKKDLIIPAGGTAGVLFNDVNTNKKATGYKKVVTNCSVSLKKAAEKTRKFSVNSVFRVSTLPEYGSRNYQMMLSEDNKTYKLTCFKKGYHRFGETWLEMTIGDLEQKLADIAVLKTSPVEEVR